MDKKQIDYDKVQRIFDAQQELLYAIDDGARNGILVEIKSYPCTDGTERFQLSIKQLIIKDIHF